MTYLARARQICADLGIDLKAVARRGPPRLVEPATDPGAALLRSATFGEVWLTLAPAVVDALAAEEADREEPRPVLRAEDAARLRGKPEAAIRAVLEMARVWPGTRVVQ